MINLLFKAFVSIIPSVGNLLVENNKAKNYDIYKKMYFLNSFLVGLFSICFVTTINPFITLWVGAKYILSFDIIIAFSVCIVVDGIRYSIMSFRDGAGICVEDKNTYIIAVIMNLLLSIVLCKFFGMIGVIIGTSMAYLFLDIYSYPKYTFKKLFNVPVIKYYLINFKFIIECVLGLIISFYITRLFVFDSNILNVVSYGLISVGIWGIIFLIFNYNSKEFNYYKTVVLNYLTKKGKS